MALPVPYFQDESCTIYHGDCRELLPLIEVSSVDLLFTDPPYGIDWKRGLHKAAGSRKHDGIQNDKDTSARDEVLAMFPGLRAVVFGSFYAPYPTNTKQVLVWKKPDDSGLYGSTTGYRRDVEPVFLVGEWPIQTVRWSGLVRTEGGISAIAAETGHPHTKPIALCRQLIDRAGGSVILDPFMGSGTTLRAAKDLGRKAIGIEIEERYCEIAARRLAQAVLPGMEVA